MSNVVENAVQQLNERLDGGIDNKVKFVIQDEGSFIIDQNGARVADEDAECTITADAETFHGLRDGSLNPTAAFMTGKLKIDGDMGVAMKLGSIFG